MKITVYSRLTCGQCDATYRALFAAGVEHFEVTLTDFDEEARKKVKELGYLQAPVVVADSDNDEVPEHWSGFRPDKVDEIVARLTEMGVELKPISFTEANQKFVELKGNLKQRAELASVA